MNRNETAHLVASSVGAIPDEVEVAMVGAGPVGLTAAAMLAGYGVRVAVLDGAAARPLQGAAEKAALEHVFTAVALSIFRVVEWLAGTPPAKRRVSAFAQLAA